MASYLYITQMLLKCLHIFGNALRASAHNFCIGNFIISRSYVHFYIIYRRVRVCIPKWKQNGYRSQSARNLPYYEFSRQSLSSIECIIIMYGGKIGEGALTIFPIWDSITTYLCIQMWGSEWGSHTDFRFIIHTFTYIIQHSHSIHNERKILLNKNRSACIRIHFHIQHCSIFSQSLSTREKYMLPWQNVNSASWWHFGIQIFCSFSHSFNSPSSNKLNSRCGALDDAAAAAADALQNQSKM